MFRAKTVLVLGAGASLEVGLPVGARLLDTIVGFTHFEFDHWRQISGDPQIFEALKLVLNEGDEVKQLNEHLQAGRQLGQSAQQAISIDNVIDALEDPKIELLAKLGIARAILLAEGRSSQFKVDPETRVLNLKNFSDTWYSSLTKLLCEGVKKSKVESIFNNIEIISFNYDRCIEQYLQYSLADYYGISTEDVRTSMKQLNIHRPYGQVGRLPWRAGEGDGVPFGSGGAEELAHVVGQIRTFTEQIEEGTRIEAMRAAIADADRIVFLGFAFHRPNVALISADIGDETEILATVLGISHSDQGVIEGELADAFGYSGTGYNLQRSELADMTCDELFKQYWRTLTAAPTS